MARRRVRKRRSRRGVWVAVALAAAVAAAFVASVFLLSGARLAGDRSELARVRLQLFAGRIASVRAYAPDGTPVRLDVRHGRLTPRKLLPSGETISLRVVVRRPGWSSWALGSERHERLTVRTPVAHIVDRWPTVAEGARPRVRFDTPVSVVSVGGRQLPTSAAAVDLPAKTTAGSTTVAAAARSWEELGPPVTVTWFPRADRPVVLADPAPGAQLDPLTPLRLTFSRPVSAVLGSDHPTLSLRQPGRWVQEDSHTLVFRPSGDGAAFAADETVRFPTPVRLLGGTTWHVAPASFLRLQQLLAQEGYLPLAWSPAAADVPRTKRAELAAAVSAPDGTFSWRYPNTPLELTSLWREGEPNEITRGAVMMFQHDHDLAVDGIAGPEVWHAAIGDALARTFKEGGYSYVYVHRNVPQLLTLWHNGRVVLTSPGNTGVPAAPTQLGTWPVFEHIPVGRMSGTNPNGTHYDDPGIRWISYFHGGEALHAFTRASFGTPQSLGCVELPLAEAAKVWPYTPIGTLVTIEN
ncbi:MAG: L,D-transpeptidase family protein [Gaiellaceae bacterium]